MNRRTLTFILAAGLAAPAAVTVSAAPLHMTAHAGLAAVAQGTPVAAPASVPAELTLTGPLATAASMRVAAGDRTAKLLIAKPLRTTPGGRSAGRLAARQPILGGPTVVPVYERRMLGAVTWLKVGVPGRPNGRRRWITTDGVSESVTAWRVKVSLSKRMVTVYRNGRVARRIRAVIGKPSTPTPAGSFFITERVRQPNGSVIGPWVLALSAFSTRLTDFAGGKGQTALHGIGRLDATPGSAASFGCVRVPDRQSRWLASKLRPGVRVIITR